MEKSMLLDVIGDTVENRIIDFLIEGRGFDYTKTNIAEGSGISRPTLYKIFPQHLNEKIIIPTRIIGNVQLYMLNAKNERIQALLKLEEFLLKRSFEGTEVEEKLKIRSKPI